MNLIRVMPAKGSGLLVAKKFEHNLVHTDGLYTASQMGSGFFLLIGMAMDIEIQINGKRERQEECSVAALVSTKNLAVGSLVVEYNGSIIKQAVWGEVILKEGDILELLNFVGGG